MAKWRLAIGRACVARCDCGSEVKKKESKQMAETPCLLSPLILGTRLGDMEGDATFILIHASHFVNR